MSDNKRPLILFSGGVDSTFLLWRTLHHDKKSCDVVYANGGQGGMKMSAEEGARRLILQWLNDNRSEGDGYVNEISVESKTYIGHNGAAFRQPLSWLVAGMEAFNPHRHSGVQIAYIAGDQINPQLYCLEAAWEYLLPVCKKIQEKAELTFPLKFISKTMLIKELPTELYKLTWVCETPVYENESYRACNKCNACTTRQVEAFRYKLETGWDLPQTVWGEDMKVPESAPRLTKEPELISS